ncbi:MAG: DUF2914 domain-containing protein [Alphaproteobacteria bacterium]|nr:DUF2914 domain-containing protein [Alphaproteobacteria bacterium]
MISWTHVLKPYERHMSAAGMLGGFAFDSVSYGRVDHAVTQTLLIVYLLAAASTITLLHFLEARPEKQGALAAKLRAYLPAATQFALGTLWSAFLVFYARSGVLAASWPFLLILAAVFIGNEVFRVYHSRLIFTAILFFFALLSYAIFMVPVFTHTIGTFTFLLSGVAAVVVFAFFLRLLDKLSKGTLGDLKWKIAFGACAVFAVFNGLYFLNVLPPLPLALQKAGVFHSIKRVGAVYKAVGEPQSWTAYLGVPQVVHVTDNEPVYVFSAIFAPISLSTTVVHTWQRYDDRRAQWVTQQRVTFAIIGGRKNGYRGYTRKSNVAPGLWRVDFDTVDGRLIGRTQFAVVHEAPTAAAVTTVLN